MLMSIDFKLLEVLDESGGRTTGDVSSEIPQHGFANARQKSGAVRSWLMHLRKQGLVAFLDDQKPTCWIRTQAGSAALVESQDRNAS